MSGRAWGSRRFEVVQRGHLDLLRESVGALEGREVKSLGDGLMVAFSGAADALACAVAMQQAVEAAAHTRAASTTAVP